MKVSNLIAPGTSIIFVDNPNKKGTVTGVNIRSGPNIKYEVTYWDGGIRKEDWVYECEIKTDEAHSLAIGFK